MRATILTLAAFGISSLGGAQAGTLNGQYTQVGQGQYTQVGQGQYTQVGQGQYTQVGQGQYTQVGQGQYTQVGQGQYTQVGQGQYTQVGQGQYTQAGQGLSECPAVQGQTAANQAACTRLWGRLYATHSCIQSHDIVANNYHLTHSKKDVAIMNRVQGSCMAQLQEQCGVTDSELQTQISTARSLCAISAQLDRLKGGAAVSSRASCVADHFYHLFTRLQK